MSRAFTEEPRGEAVHPNVLLRNFPRSPEVSHVVTSRICHARIPSTTVFDPRKLREHSTD